MYFLLSIFLLSLKTERRLESLARRLTQEGECCGGAYGHGSHLAQRFPSKSKSLSQRFVRELFGGGGALSALRVFLPLLLLLPHPQDLELVPRDQLGIDDVQVLRRPQVDVGELRQAAPQLGAEYLEALRAAAPGRLLGKGQ